MATILGSRVKDPSLLRPFFPPAQVPGTEPPSVDTVTAALSLERHPLGGYFTAIDRSPQLIQPPSRNQPSGEHRDPIYRNMYSSIMHLLTVKQPNIYFHYNLSNAVHALHRGRARYAVIRMDLERDEDGFQPIETFVVGPNVVKGEQLQWTVAGGNWKVCWLLPDSDEIAQIDEAGEGKDVSNSKMLISEVVSPGFDMEDFAVLTMEKLRTLVRPTFASAMEWLISP